MAFNWCIHVAIDIYDGENTDHYSHTGATFIIENDRPLSEVLADLHDMIADTAEETFARCEVSTGQYDAPAFVIWSPSILSVEKC